MKRLRMRGYRHSTVVLLGLALSAGTALAENKKKPPPKPAKPTAPAKDAGGDIEMGGDDKPAKGAAPGTTPATPAAGGEIDMGEPDKSQDLAADLNASDAQNNAVKT